MPLIRDFPIDNLGSPEIYTVQTVCQRVRIREKDRTVATQASFNVYFPSSSTASPRECRRGISLGSAALHRARHKALDRIRQRWLGSDVHHRRMKTADHLRLIAQQHPEETAGEHQARLEYRQKNLNRRVPTPRPLWHWILAAVVLVGLLLLAVRSSSAQTTNQNVNINRIGGTLQSGSTLSVNCVIGCSGSATAIGMQVRNAGDTAWVNVGFNVANLTLPVTLQTGSATIGAISNTTFAIDEHPAARGAGWLGISEDARTRHRGDLEHAAAGRSRWLGLSEDARAGHRGASTCTAPTLPDPCFASRLATQSDADQHRRQDKERRGIRASTAALQPIRSRAGTRYGVRGTAGNRIERRRQRRRARVDAANNAAAPANVLVNGVETIAQGSQPTAATAGNVRRSLATVEGALFVQEGSSNRFSCFVQAVTVTTQCQAAPGAGLRAYVTSAHLANQAATVQTLDIVFGTGAACVTATTALTHKMQFGTNGTTTSPIDLHMTFQTPLVPTAANAICVRPSAATAFGATLTGFIAP
jgi:hypothetical protein